MSNTAHRAYPKPVPSNNVSDDVLVLQQAMDLVDGDIHLLFAAIATLAPVNHEHVIADVQGLSAALAGKAAVDHAHTLEDLSDVAGATSAPVGSVLVKQVDGNWGPASPASIVGLHQHVIGDVVNLQTALDGLASSPQIAAATEQALDGADFVGARRATDGAFIKSTWSTLRSAVVVAFGGILVNRTAKTTPIDADLLAIADSAATNATKKTTFLEAWTNYFKVKADALYQPVKTILTTLGNLANGSGYLLNNGSGGLSWGTIASLTAVKETWFTSSGTFTPDANGKFYEFLVVGTGSGGASGANGSTGRDGTAGAVVVASGPKANVGSAALAITIGTQGASMNVAGTPTSVAGLVSADSGRLTANNGAGVATTGNSNLPQSAVYGVAAFDTNPNYFRLPQDPAQSLPFGAAGQGGVSGNTNQSAGSGGAGRPGVVVVREYLG